MRQFSSVKCVFLFQSNEIITFSTENADSPKRVVDFPRERDTFRNKVMESSRILRVNPMFFTFLQFFYLHFLSFSFFFFHFISCSFIFFHILFMFCLFLFMFLFCFAWHCFSFCREVKICLFSFLGHNFVTISFLFTIHNQKMQIFGPSREVTFFLLFFSPFFSPFFFFFFLLCFFFYRICIRAQQKMFPP